METKYVEGDAWLQIVLLFALLIPLFGQFWQFFVVSKIAGSIRKEMGSWHDHSIFGSDALVAEGGGRRPAFGIGIAYCSLNTAVILINLFGNPAGNYGLVGLMAIAGTVCWIIYWVQLAQYKNKLKRGAAAMAG